MGEEDRRDSREWKGIESLFGYVFVSLGRGLFVGLFFLGWG